MVLSKSGQLRDKEILQPDRINQGQDCAEMHQDRECWPLFPIILFPSLMMDSSGVEMFAPVISGTQTPQSLRRTGKSTFFFMSSLFSPSKVWSEGEELHRSCPTWRAGEIIFV